MTPSFKYSKRIFTCSRLKQVPWRLHVKRPSYSCFFHWSTQRECTIAAKEAFSQSGLPHPTSNRPTTCDHQVSLVHVKEPQGYGIWMVTKSGYCMLASLCTTTKQAFYTATTLMHFVELWCASWTVNVHAIHKGHTQRYQTFLFSKTA